MLKVYPIIGAVLSFTALILLGIGASTSKWVVLSQTQADVNPTVINSKLGTLQDKLGTTSSTVRITYSVSHFGLWMGCHKEHKGAVSCAFIKPSCKSNVCWIRKTPSSSDKTCLETRLAPIVHCVSFQVVRVFVLLGLLLMVCGVCTQLVSLLMVKRSLAMLGGLILFTSGLFVMTAFAIFYRNGWADSALGGIARRGYSYNLVTACWPLAIIAGLLSCFAASMGLRHKDVSDITASNY